MPDHVMQFKFSTCWLNPRSHRCLQKDPFTVHYTAAICHYWILYGRTYSAERHHIFNGYYSGLFRALLPHYFIKACCLVYSYVLVLITYAQLLWHVSHSSLLLTLWPLDTPKSWKHENLQRQVRETSSPPKKLCVPDLWPLRSKWERECV